MNSLTLLLRSARQNRRDLALEDFSERQIHWAIESGLGPMLRRYVADTPTARDSAAWADLQGSDLAARIIAAEHLDAMAEIIRACEGRIQPPTLLKGISVGGQFYPEPHLRPMRDIDFLVEKDDLPTVESALRQLGYRQESTLSREFYETHHHTTPFRHPQTGVWVEVHRGLCPGWSPVATDPCFSLEHVSAERRSSEFRGYAVNRLSEELQVLYLASHWAYDFRMAGGLVAMLDTIYLLESTRSIRWERILGWLKGTAAATPVYLLLTYLDRHGLVELPSGLIGELFRRQRCFGRTSLGLLHTMIDRYVTNGREPGRIMSERNFAILWQSLLLSGPEFRKLPLIFWMLLPSRHWLMRTAPSPALPGPAPDTS